MEKGNGPFYNADIAGNIAFKPYENKSQIVTFP